ncbi:hypothetical protein CKA32_006973 [Geitlerinema sp. FC II]|nr:hypothetical protein CKA32_006973 [Geitlerinema sp. FC II]
MLISQPTSKMSTLLKFCSILSEESGRQATLSLNPCRYWAFSPAALLQYQNHSLRIHLEFSIDVSYGKNL